MKSKRVYELAKEFGVEGKDIIAAAKEIGVRFSTSSNAVDATTEDRLRNIFNSAQAAASQKTPDEDGQQADGKKVVIDSADGKITEKRSADRVVRRRKKADKAPDAPETEEAEAAQPEESAASAETPPASAETPAKAAPKKAAAPKKEKEAEEVDPEKEKLAQQMKAALAPSLKHEKLSSPPQPRVAGRKKEYVVDEKNLRRKQIPRKKRPMPGQTPSAPSPAAPPAGKKSVTIGETIMLDDLARRMEVKLQDVRAKARGLGVDTRSRNPFDYEVATLIAAEYGLEVEVDRFDESIYLDDAGAGFGSEEPRPPVVSVMGHVDHGKTTLLDTLRNASVAPGEAGGITQHIGAYKVKSGDREIVFIDTPGHEAFTAMRARGAGINDLAILVVAADDGVKEQTVEAISHAKAAGVPAIVAVNKIDKEGADTENVKRQLSEHGLVSEEWGGDTLFAEISAKTGEGLKDLLELIILQADVLELKAPGTGQARGIVLESRLDKGRGAIADVIVTKGSLKVGDQMVAGLFSGKIRALSDESGSKAANAGPSMPVEVMGLSGVPDAGENFYIVGDEKTARAIVENRRTEAEQKDAPSVPQPLSLDSIEMTNPPEEKGKELALVIKADTQGSLEAIKDSIAKIDSDKCSIKIAHSAAGGISGTDVELAYVTDAVIFGFNVRPDSKAAADADKREVAVETYSIVYEIVERVKQMMEGMLDPVIEEETIGHAQVKEVFRMSGQKIIAGCFVDDGKVQRGESVRIVREGAVVYESKVGSLKRFKDDVREVQSGYECGLTIENFNDVKVGDVLEVYSVKETAQQL